MPRYLPLQYLFYEVISVTLSSELLVEIHSHHQNGSHLWGETQLLPPFHGTSQSLMGQKQNLIKKHGTKTLANKEIFFTSTD